MAVAQISILSRNDIETVHAKTLEILNETGVMVQSEKALKVLEDGGATVDWKTMRARLPESLVDEAVAKIPKKVTLASRNPKLDMVAPRAGLPYMATNGTAVYVSDIDTGERRVSTGKDLRDLMVLCDAMDALDYVWPIVTAHDAPVETHALSEMTISLTSTTKHVQGEAMSSKEALGEIEVASAIAGSTEALAKRPLFSVIQCPVCPLEFEKGSIEAVMEFAMAGIPVVSMSMALCGLTSPVTLAGTVAVVNAENLASFAISQMTKQGAPVVYSSESSSINMRTGEIHYGSLEEMLISAAVSQMAKSYGAPVMVGEFGASLSGESPGISAEPSEIMFAGLTALSMTDFSSGIGGLDQAKGAALEQVIIDCDLWETIRDMRKEVHFDDAHFVADLIDSVGPGGSYIKEAHTARNMRKELFLPPREKSEIFSLYRLDKDHKEFVRRARDRAKKILETHVPDPIGSDVKAQIDMILEKYQK